MKFWQVSSCATLLIIISILNILIAALVGSIVYQSWDNLHDVKELRQTSETANLLYEAEKFLSMERGLSLIILDSPEGMFPTLKDELTSSRQNANERLRKGLSRIEPKDNPELEGALLQLRNSHRNLENIRNMIDVILTSSGTISQADYDQIFDTFTSTISDIEVLIRSYSRPLLSINATVSQQMIFKNHIWEITEYAGREYATIGKLIVKNMRPTAEIGAQLVNWRNRMEHNWEMVSDLAKGGQLEQTIAPYITDAQTYYSITLEQVKNIFESKQTIENTAPYPIGIDLWLKMATKTTDSLHTLQDVVLHETQNYIKVLEHQAKQAIAMSLLLFAFSLALSVYSWWLISQKLVKPVNAMVNSLYIEAHHADPALYTQNLSERDEIEKLAIILEAFRKNTQNLEDQRNHLKTVLKTVMDAIITIDSTGTIRMINPAVEKMFGYREKELIGKNVKILMPESYASQHDDYIGNYLETGKAKIIGQGRELEAKRKDGTTFPVEISVSEMRRNGEHTFVGVLRDITERKQAEEERLRYTKSLEDSNRELDDFAYIASHDLKEPLRGLHNFSRFLLEDYEDKLDEEGQKMLRTISKLTKRMDELLSTLLHYSRLGRTELSVRPTDLNKIVHNALEINGVQIKESHTHVKIMDKLPTVVCDHVRIAEVFQNLIGNALKYNDKEKKKIEIGFVTDHPEVVGEIVYFVRDNGIGIERKHLDSIFKIFRRLHAQEAYGGGTGSGLTIARKIILQHGGKIWAESKGKGQGTIFLFTIPAPAVKKNALRKAA